MTKVPSDADIVFFPTQRPRPPRPWPASSLSRARRRRFGGDGTNGPGQFKAAGSYVSNFAPQIDTIAADKSVIAARKKDNPGKAVGSFGPLPTYGAVR